jgi:hypothetical protein
MQQTIHATDSWLGADFTAPEPKGHLGRGPDAPAPWGRFGRGEMRFGVRGGGALAPQKRSSGAFLAPNARARLRGQGVDTADYPCNRQLIGCGFHRARTDGALGARP